MSNDLSGGLTTEQDYFFSEQPGEKEMRESWSLWFFDDAGHFGLPRCGIEREAWNWGTPRVQGNFAFGDGRVLNGATVADAHSPFDASGTPAILGAGPIAWTTIEPFRKWRFRWEGPVRDGTVEKQIAREMPVDLDTPLLVEIELEAAAPCWTQIYSAEEVAGLSEQEKTAAGNMGIGWRLEQLVTGKGQVTYKGETYAFQGRGTRVKRQSVRPMAGFHGHCWQSAIFPDGRGFAYIAYPPSADGSQFNEGVIVQDGKLHPAEVVEAPWLRRVVPSGDDISFTLKSALGETRVKATTAFATFRVGNPELMGLNLHQGGGLYEWDGQKAFGMIERSANDSQIRFE